MPVLMYCPVDRTIETTFGYVFGFKKNEPLSVPDRMVKFVSERGAFPVDGEEAKVVAATEAEKTDKQLEPTDYTLRLQMIGDKIVELHKSGDLLYTAGSKPNTKQLERVLKFAISIAERDEAWDAVKNQVLES